MDDDAAFISEDAAFGVIGTDIFRFGHEQDAEFEAYANLELILDAETELQGYVDVVGVDLGPSEVLFAAI